ncbi:FAD binding domain-containing protein [Phakopsora pachyrhizi]|nr:FAD binding domain-containing protein [Phakopsora pachyrhizi]
MLSSSSNQSISHLKTYLCGNDVFDVVIVGAGPAGLMASLCLKTFCFKVLHIDNQAQPTLCGKADGIQARTIENYPTDHIDLATHLISQGAKAYGVAFWDPADSKRLGRTSKSQVCPEFIDVRERYTLLLHQGLIEKEFLREIYNRSTCREDPIVIRPAKFINAQNLTSSAEDFFDDGHLKADDDSKIHEEFYVRSKYLLGCDGARSDVRKSLNGRIVLEGHSCNVFWAVMDCWVQSDFPDFKLKCAVHSKRYGSLMIIPREDDLVRFYVQLKIEEDSERAGEIRMFSFFCQNRAKNIFEPYSLKFRQTEWFSIYQIGQRLANKYTLDGRILLGGDSVHTHSPKAGQGMNISMLDMHSLGWKINLVEKGIGKRKEIMETYESERRGVASDLIKFDAEYSALFSGVSSSTFSKNSKIEDTKVKIVGEVDAQRFIDVFKKNISFITGCGAIYRTNVLNALPDADIYKKRKYTKIQSPLKPGERFLPGNATRLIDGEVVQLEQEVKMDGSFRIYIFLGSAQLPKINSCLGHLVNTGVKDGERRCFLDRFKSPTGKPCSIFDCKKPKGCNPFFSLSLISSGEQTEWEIEDLPEIFSQKFRSQVYSDDQVNYYYGDDLNLDLNLTPRKSLAQLKPLSLHAKYGIEEDHHEGGGIIVVRPDGYVGLIADLTQDGWETLEDYFDGFLIDQSSKCLI